MREDGVVISVGEFFPVVATIHLDNTLYQRSYITHRTEKTLINNPQHIPDSAAIKCDSRGTTGEGFC